jgi:hypothetical protein
MCCAAIVNYVVELGELKRSEVGDPDVMRLRGEVA